ncbi:nucleotidyltransferase family protein [Candidatus Woesearchaeota archaeon]|nr:nucleotidyltransferase family protein [Candidatus Woesearchaeota archaeon]
MERDIDAIILAGTKGTSKLKLGDLEDYKPFIKICGKTIVEYVIEAALDCPELRRVYVVTDLARMHHALAKSGPTDDERLIVIPDEGSIISNLRSAISYHILPDAGFETFEYDKTPTQAYLRRNAGAHDLRTVGLYGDSPFMTGADISRFIETSDQSADYVVGFSREAELTDLENVAGEILCSPELKTALFPFAGTAIRANNMVMGKPLRIPDEVWNLAQAVYDNRHLLTKKGEKNKRNWRKIYEIFKEYTLGHATKKPTVLWGFLLGAVLYRKFRKAHDRGKEWAAENMSQDEYELAAYHITGNKCYGSMNICDVAMPTFDVDNEEMLRRLLACDSDLFRKMRAVKREYPKNLEIELEKLVEEHPTLFDRAEPIDEEEWQNIVRKEGI